MLYRESTGVRSMWLSDFYEIKKKEAIETGAKYTLVDMCKFLGCSLSRLSRISAGTQIITMKMADLFEERTNGVLIADELLEISIAKHRKYLERKKKFGDLRSREKKMKEEIFGNRK